MADPARLQTVFYAVDDMPRARRFYEGLLGAAVTFADGARWVQYDAGGTRFCLGGADEAHPDMAGAAMVFEVTDLDAHAQAVARCGGAVRDRRDMGTHGTTLVVADPDGNILHLWARAAPGRGRD